nr:family 10 xylanase [uncultured bacterium]
MSISRRKFTASLLALGALSQMKTSALAKAIGDSGLKAAFRDDFYIGTAVSTSTLAENDTDMLALIAREFNAITAENAMKWEVVRPELDSWQWELADKFMEFGVRNNMYVVGHTLAWHSQVPPAVFLDKKGKPLEREPLLARLDDHIRTLVSRYKGKIHAWDVANEVVEDDGQFRQSPWFKATGTDFIEQAFRTAHEIDPKAHLMYNDYNMAVPAKRDAVIAMVKAMKKKGVPIHGIGMQGHIGVDTPDLTAIEDSILAFAALGVKVHFTEMDIDVLPSVWGLTGAEITTRFEYKPERDPYKNGLTADMEEKLAQRYEALFKLFIKHRDKIERVTTWGVSDDTSWLNDFPIVGRTSYPLLFDRKHQPKAAYHRLMNLKR